MIERCQEKGVIKGFGQHINLNASVDIQYYVDKWIWHWFEE